MSELDLATLSDTLWGFQNGVTKNPVPGGPFMPLKSDLSLGGGEDVMEGYNARFTPRSFGGSYEFNTLFRLRSQNANALTWQGGTFVGSFPNTTSWERMHNAYAVTLEDWPNFPVTLRHLRIHNTGDGINVFKNVLGPVTVDRVYISKARDDAIQNDFHNPMTISNSLFDGVFIFYSSRPYIQGMPDKSGTVVTINNNLVYVKDMPTTFLGSLPGHGRFFKMDSNATGFIDPKLTLTNNIFRVDNPHVCCGNFMLPPTSRTVTVSGNTIVWGGQAEFGNFPYPVPTGWTLTTDTNVWTAAVAAWKADSLNQWPPAYPGAHSQEWPEYA